MATRNKMTTRETKLSRRGEVRRGTSQKPFWRIDTVANEKRAREIEAEASQETSEIRRQGMREVAQRIREGELDKDYMFDYRQKKELPKIDLCKIRPERFRDMGTPELDRALFFIGPVTLKDRISKSNPRGLARNLISNLIDDRRYGRDNDVYKRLACDAEKAIYDAQQKKGCPISRTDVAARDALREQSCDAPYPTEKLNKIRDRRKAQIRGPKIR